VAKIKHSQFVPLRHYWFELSEIFSPTEYVHNSYGKLSCKTNWGLLICLLVRFYVIGILLSYNFCTLFTVVSCYRHVVYIWEWRRLLICFMSIGSQRGIVANLYCKLSNMGREGTVPGMWSIFHPISCWANIICSIPTYYKQVFHFSLFLTLKKKVPYKASVFCCGNHSSSWNFTTHSCEEKNDLHVSVFWQDLHNQKHSSCSNRS